MANAEHKLKIVHLMDILRRETDAQHPISMSKIKDKLSTHLSGHKPDRKAIYDDFDALEAYGFVVHREPNGKRYYSRDYMSQQAYNKMCVNKDTKIHMPKAKVDERLDIVAFTKAECDIMDEYFAGTNTETAYLLGRYCGLRINECFGLKWDCVDLENGMIRIERQMQYQDGIIKLVTLKTKNAYRTIYLNERMKQ